MYRLSYVRPTTKRTGTHTQRKTVSMPHNGVSQRCIMGNFYFFLFYLYSLDFSTMNLGFLLRISIKFAIFKKELC